MAYQANGHVDSLIGGGEFIGGPTLDDSNLHGRKCRPAVSVAFTRRRALQCAIGIHDTMSIAILAWRCAGPYGDASNDIFGISAYDADGAAARVQQMPGDDSCDGAWH